MATTRLSTIATPTRPYGTFAGKSAAFVGRLQVTRLGVMATPTRRYGSFAGKAAATPPAGGDLRLRMLMGMGL